MADLVVTEQLQDYLVAQAVCQLPAAAPSTTLPSIWDNPPDGAPQPRNATQDGAALELATITLVEISAPLQGPVAGWLQEVFVDVVIRATTDTAAKLLHRKIRDLLYPFDVIGGRKLWTMGALLVERSFEQRPEQPLPREDDRYYDRVCTYGFEARRKALAGLPYAP